MAFYTATRVYAAFTAFSARAPQLPFEKESSLEVALGPEGAFEKLTAGLRLLRFGWLEGDGVFYGRRGRFGLVAAVLLHLGLLCALVGLVWGVRAPREEVFVFERERVGLPPAFGSGLELSADGVDVFTDGNTGALLSYRTDLRLWQDGNEVAAKEIEINRPLRYGGLAIYQRAASEDAKGLLLEEIVLKEGVSADEYSRVEFSWESGGDGGSVTLLPGEAAELGETGVTLQYVAYFERFFANKDTYGDDGPEYNPTAVISMENARGDTAEGALFKLYPDKSFYRSTVSDFAEKPLTVEYAGDSGPWRVARRERVLASGSYVGIGGGETMRVEMAEGEGSDLSVRALEGVITRRDGREEKIEFPYNVGTGVRAAGGNRIYKFAGSREAPVAALTASREPTSPLFYVACVLFVVGVVGVSLFRYDELVAYVREGRVYLAARSSKGADVIKPAFDEWAARARKDPRGDAA